MREGFPRDMGGDGLTFVYTCVWNAFIDTESPKFLVQWVMLNLVAWLNFLIQ